MSENGNGAAPEAPQVKMQVMAQYIRDMSFENAVAQKGLAGSEVQPEIQVAVSLDHAPQDAVVLSPGQRVSYDRRGMTPVQDLSEDAGQSWERGLLVFERMTLVDVVDRLNRYHSSRIVVRDQMLAQRRVSGVFLQSDASGAVQAIAQELGAQLLQLPGVVVFF